ncbi:MAG: hypothetical protein ABIX01_19920 [Chitinophagaceae bacterium]
MKQLFSVLFISLVFFSCKKKTEAPQPPAQTKENIAGLYKLTALTLSTSGSAETSVIDSYLTTCQKDDLQQLKTDFTFNYIDAGILCSPAGDKTGTWSLPAAGKITINGQAFDIVSFTGTVLVASTVQLVLGTPSTIKSTLTKQ